MYTTKFYNLDNNFFKLLLILIFLQSCNFNSYKNKEFPILWRMPPTHLKLLEEGIPREIKNLPRLIIGIQSRERNNIIPDSKFLQWLIPPVLLDAREDDVTLNNKIFCEMDNVFDPNDPNIIRKIKKGDHVIGDAFDPNIIAKIKEGDQGKFSAIVFERTALLPLYWTSFLKKFLSDQNNFLYKLPPEEDMVDENKCITFQMNEAIGKYLFYKRGDTFYRRNEQKISVTDFDSSLKNHQISNTSDSMLVKVVLPSESIYDQHSTVAFNKDRMKIENILAMPEPQENPILKEYYEFISSWRLISFYDFFKWNFKAWWSCSKKGEKGEKGIRWRTLFF